ncbi:hypothetical protein L3X38_030207 [Prunus dulcis]|uniref:Integrase zinc-binding domain-containing protein n=1 Tax=Prunus dulcis TaxID=3755 RepID=A0AAD4VC00_PRUDU|nr:hypothetical protein L3X38_030207 [Prunus dulcis]
MVRKAKGGWRMCHDYAYINKACPKDSFLLPQIDQLVDATASHELLSFMDAYSGLPVNYTPTAQKFQTYEIWQISMTENSHADALAQLASALNNRFGRKVPGEILHQPSTATSDVCTVRRGYTTPYQKCITTGKGDYVLREIHGSICGDHSGSRSLAHKAFQQGYYWPTMHQDANTLVKTCDKCQRFGNKPHIPAEPLIPIISPWHFAQWGLDLIGPMPQGKGQVKQFDSELFR